MLKDVLLIMWAMFIAVMVSWAVLANTLFGTDHSVLVVTATAIFAPPLLLGAFALVYGYGWCPFNAWRRTRAGTGDWWELGEYLLSPVHLTRLHRGWGWRRSLKEMTGSDLRRLLAPYFEERYDAFRGVMVNPAVPRTTHSTYAWLVAGLDPTLLVDCLRVGIVDDDLDAHRAGTRPLDESAIRTLAALREPHHRTT